MPSIRFSLLFSYFLPSSIAASDHMFHPFKRILWHLPLYFTLSHSLSLQLLSKKPEREREREREKKEKERTHKYSSSLGMVARVQLLIHDEASVRDAIRWSGDRVHNSCLQLSLGVLAFGLGKFVPKTATWIQLQGFSSFLLLRFAACFTLLFPLFTPFPLYTSGEEEEEEKEREREKGRKKSKDK